MIDVVLAHAKSVDPLRVALRYHTDPSSLSNDAALDKAKALHARCIDAYNAAFVELAALLVRCSSTNYYFFRRFSSVFFNKIYNIM